MDRTVRLAPHVVSAPAEHGPSVGVDLGRCRPDVTSGNRFFGRRQWRRGLQRQGTPFTQRHLCRLSGKANRCRRVCGGAAGSPAVCKPRSGAPLRGLLADKAREAGGAVAATHGTLPTTTAVLQATSPADPAVSASTRTSMAPGASPGSTLPGWLHATPAGRGGPTRRPPIRVDKPSASADGR